MMSLEKWIAVWMDEGRLRPESCFPAEQPPFASPLPSASIPSTSSFPFEFDVPSVTSEWIAH